MTTAAARKGDTIRKIEFGGLVIKGGLSEESKAVILGAIADAACRLADPAKRDRAVIYYKQLGDEVFLGQRK
jgi:hypothetical protein